MSVAGFAENAPADTNETSEGRVHNCRVDVVVLSAEALRGEPPPCAAQDVTQSVTLALTELRSEGRRVSALQAESLRH